MICQKIFRPKFGDFIARVEEILIPVGLKSSGVMYYKSRDYVALTAEDVIPLSSGKDCSGRKQFVNQVPVHCIRLQRVNLADSDIGRRRRKPSRGREGFLPPRRYPAPVDWGSFKDAASANQASCTTPLALAEHCPSTNRPFLCVPLLDVMTR